jgi:FKBP-type peptidyl-prolyl cis-trans isomerase
VKRTVLSAAAAAVLVLSACSADESTPAESPAATEVDPKSTSLDDVTVSGDAGAEPTVEFEAPLAVEETASTVVEEGDGEEVEEGMQVTAHMTLVSGTSGEVVESSYDSEQASGFPTDREQINQGLFDAVVGEKVGSRVLLALNGPAQSGAAPETLLYVIDIDGVDDIPEPLERAEGEERELPEDFPAVTRGEDGAPSIEQPSGEAPTELETAYAIEGEGPEVEAGQNVTVHYTGWLWDDAAEPFDSSWERGEPFSVQNVGQGQVIAGWNEGLVGQKVGSQVVLVVPPDKGYGENGSPPSIPGGATLVFVVDILSAVG